MNKKIDDARVISALAELIGKVTGTKPPIERNLFPESWMPHIHAFILELGAAQSSDAAMSEWQPIETAPQTGPIDLWTKGRSGEWRVPGAWWTEENGWLWGEVDHLYKVAGMPTHWMPLPEPPK